MIVNQLIPAVGPPIFTPQNLLLRVSLSDYNPQPQPAILVSPSVVLLLQRRLPKNNVNRLSFIDEVKTFEQNKIVIFDEFRPRLGQDFQLFEINKTKMRPFFMLIFKQELRGSLIKTLNIRNFAKVGSTNITSELRTECKSMIFQNFNQLNIGIRTKLVDYEPEKMKQGGAIYKNMGGELALVGICLPFNMNPIKLTSDIVKQMGANLHSLGRLNLQINRGILSGQLQAQLRELDFNRLKPTLNIRIHQSLEYAAQKRRLLEQTQISNSQQNEDENFKFMYQQLSQIAHEPVQSQVAVEEMFDQLDEQVTIISIDQVEI